MTNALILTYGFGRLVGHLEKARISRKNAKSRIGPGTKDTSDNRLRLTSHTRESAEQALLPPNVALIHRKDSHERFHSVDFAVVNFK